MIDQKFLKLKSDLTKGQLLGKNRFIGHDGQSCSGLTYELLQSTKFDKDIPLLNSLKPQYLYTTPTSLFQMAAIL